MAGPLGWKAAAFVQTYKRGLLAAACAGLFAANVSYHLLPDRTLRPIYQYWPQGRPARLPEALRGRFQEVLRDAGLEAAGRGYRAFAAFSFFPVSAGFPWLPGGALVGIPASFQSAPEPDGPSLVARGLTVDWRSRDGAALKDALTLSPDAQKFALAREVLSAQGGHAALRALPAPVCLAGTCLGAVAAKQALGLYAGPRVLRGLCNVVVWALGFVAYSLSCDALTHFLEYRLDRNTAAISAGYARGGLEFYDKILACNRSLRSLMGKRGEELYAPSGNLFPRHWFRIKHAPYTSRRDRIKGTLGTAPGSGTC
ncbi:transmembrane protein 177 [Ornithorhynchus anatinus]|uniref:transmembrane protein 177 n=1 Tax=Ornithorhynchus anatinus TaxID=9258 RepID=UPI0010A91244|nr:transmembrane protein 177 [Ornithorhynchus anatinus]